MFGYVTIEMFPENPRSNLLERCVGMLKLQLSLCIVTWKTDDPILNAIGVVETIATLPPSQENVPQ